MTAKYNTIIARSAKNALSGLGFRQKGRSRLWLADHQSWLNIVEFTPSQWAKAVSLTNAAHWLWAGNGFLAFHESSHSRQREEFETEEQFEKAVAKITEEAAAKAEEKHQSFSSIEQTAEFLVERARSSPDRMMLSWWGYQAGIASGLCGDFRSAKTFLAGITDKRVVQHAIQLLALADDERGFKNRLNEIVTQQRRALNLAALQKSLF